MANGIEHGGGGGWGGGGGREKSGIVRLQMKDSLKIKKSLHPVSKPFKLGLLSSSVPDEFLCNSWSHYKTRDIIACLL